MKNFLYDVKERTSFFEQKSLVEGGEGRLCVRL